MTVSAACAFDKVVGKLCGMNSRIGHGCSCTPALSVRKKARRESGWSSVAVGVASAVVSVSVSMSVCFVDADFGTPIGPRSFVGWGGGAVLSSGNMSKTLDGAAWRGSAPGVELAVLLGTVSTSLLFAFDGTVGTVDVAATKTSFLGM